MHYVPRQPFLDLITEYMQKYGLSATECSKVWGMDASYVHQTFNQKSDRMEFNKADYLLCKMRKVNLWYEAPYNEWYWDGDVPPDRSKPVRCSMDDCDKWFSLPIPVVGSNGVLSHGAWNRMYCSDTCKTRAWAHRSATNMPRQKFCMNGHERTDENQQKYTKNGKEYKRCKVCVKESRLRNTGDKKIITAETRKKWREQKRRQRAKKNGTKS